MVATNMEIQVFHRRNTEPGKRMPKIIVWSFFRRKKIRILPQRKRVFKHVREIFHPILVVYTCRIC